MEKNMQDKKVEDLLKPRYLVIADYPDSPFDVNEILYQSTGAGKHNKDYWTLKRGGLYNIHCKQYTKIFRELRWYENREISEMPEYVKVVENNAYTKVIPDEHGNYENGYEEIVHYPKKGTVIKCSGSYRWEDLKPMYLISNEDDCIEMNAMTLIPATESEYQTYLQTLK